MSNNPRLAFVQDALPMMGGAERVLAAALQAFPGTPVYTLVYNARHFQGTVFERQNIHTSFIDRLPGAHRNHRLYVPLFPFAIEQFDLRPYDVVVSFSYAVAHGALTRPDQLHLCLYYTPLRQAWQSYQSYLQGAAPRNQPSAWAVRWALHYLRQWDWGAAARVDRPLAISRWVAACIWHTYRRRARVLYPPVDVGRFHPAYPRGDYYMALTRLEAHKRVDLVVEAFNRLGLPLLIVGEGRERSRLEKLAGANIRFLGYVPDETVGQLLGRAKALVHAAEEDFGIALVEAQAAGCPVIAYRGGAASETVLPGRTGMLYPQQSAESLADAVRQFARNEQVFQVDELVANAARFDSELWREKFTAYVLGSWYRFRGHSPGNRHPRDYRTQLARGHSNGTPVSASSTRRLEPSSTETTYRRGTVGF